MSYRRNGLMSYYQDDEQVPIQSRFSDMSLIESNETLVNNEGRLADTSQGQLPDTVYVIRTPTALQRFLNTQPLSSIKIIRLILLHQLESVKLTAEEEYGCWGPNVNPLFDAWRTAFKSIPPTIELIIVDVRHSFCFETLLLGRLVQHLSTSVHLRSGRRAHFEVQGARTVRGNAFIEGSMIGLKEGTAENWDRKKLVIGAD